MEIKLTEFQFFLSTAEDEKNYFFGSMPKPPPEIHREQALPPGTYRIIDGEVFRVMPGVPPLK